MSKVSQSDPRFNEAAASDEDLLDAHKRLQGLHPGDGAGHRLLQVGILVALGGFALFAGTYLYRYAGRFSPLVFDEDANPSSGAPVAVKMDPVTLGKYLYNAVCITCHQAKGVGTPSTYPPLAASEWVNGSPARVIRIVVYGLKGEVHVGGHSFSEAAMPVFGQVTGSSYNWSDARIAAVLTYVRQEWGNKAGAVTAEEIAAVRKSVGERKEMMTEAELEQFE